jgi:TolB protein
MLLLAPLVLMTRLSAPRAQGVDVFLNVTGGGAKKLNIAIPEFTLVGGADPAGAAKALAAVIGADLSFSGLFQVVSATGPVPPNNPDVLRKLWSDFAAAGAHAGLHGLLTVRGDRLDVEARLYDLTSADQRPIATKKFEMPAAQVRRLAHRIADDVVLQFTGQRGIADTKLAFTRAAGQNKEIYMSDYDGAGPVAVTQHKSLNLSPVWSPDGQHVALTLSKDGNPEIYVLNVGTGVFRRLTRHPSIDTEPTWSPDGRQMAFVSDRLGTPRIYAMDAEGGNVRQLTEGAAHTQPRWSPRGDVSAYTAREGRFTIWVVNADGSSPRRLADSGDNQSSTWSPDGRHLAFQTSRLGGQQIFAMFPDGSGQTPLIRGGSDTSPSWSPRLP